MQIYNGWLNEIEHIHSPNYNDRPKNINIELIVIHNISLPIGKFNNNYICDLFTNKLDQNAHDCFSEIADLKVSAHILIKRDGYIIQFVAFHKRAWHAGKSCFNSKTNCNDFSIGIELEGTDNLAYAEIQYQQLNKLIEILRQHYPKITDITGHSNVAPKRKTDPGKAFDWNKI
jgi:AmpD protein